RRQAWEVEDDHDRPTGGAVRVHLQPRRPLHRGHACGGDRLVGIRSGHRLRIPPGFRGRAQNGSVIVGVPTEVKDSESRVAMTPDGVRELVSRGHEVRVESGAGLGSSIADDEYTAAGATLTDVDAAWAAELVVKVKEPQGAELSHLRADLVLA